jgi:retron-type reverse transcriptase
VRYRASAVDADLKSYFDTIPHERLMARVEEKVSDGRLLDLIRARLKADILKGLDDGRRPRARRVALEARLRHDAVY